MPVFMLASQAVVYRWAFCLGIVHFSCSWAPLLTCSATAKTLQPYLPLVLRARLANSMPCATDALSDLKPDAHLNMTTTLVKKF